MQKFLPTWSQLFDGLAKWAGVIVIALAASIWFFFYRRSGKIAGTQAIISAMLEPYIRPYLEKFCSEVTVDELCQIVERAEDVYPAWLEEFSDDQKPPPFAYFFEDAIKEEVKKVLAETSLEHFRVFDLNPIWANRQLDGLLQELFKNIG